jgi:dTDP-4-amino-4,6-dideoxygalactose transaminase
MQAAVLRARLPFLEGWTTRRRQLGRKYRDALADVTTVTVPPESDAGHVYHLFPVLSPARDALQAHLRSNGIETLIHYPVPIPRQPALASEAPADCPIAARVCGEVLSLPLYPQLDERAIGAIAGALAAGPAPAAERVQTAER